MNWLARWKNRNRREERDSPIGKTDNANNLHVVVEAWDPVTNRRVKQFDANYLDRFHRKRIGKAAMWALRHGYVVLTIPAAVHKDAPAEAGGEAPS